MLTPLKHNAKLALLVTFLIVSSLSLRAIPFLNPWGADLHNLIVYQKCTAGRSPYAVDPVPCGDRWSRAMVYPPLLYHAFRWTRPLSEKQATYVWALFLFVAAAAALYAWVRLIAREKKDAADWELWLFGGLLLIQFPFGFALERGQVDMGALLLWTTSAYFFARRRMALSGIAAGLATAYKLYPLFPCLIIGAALFFAALRARHFRWADFFRFSGGAAGAFVLTSLLFYSDSKIYFLQTLPQLATTRSSGTGQFSHALPAFVGDYGHFTALLGLGLVGVWIWSAYRSLARNPATVFAGALAMSTYLQGMSFDYNLITVYPLLMLTFVQARKSGRWALLALGLAGIVADRRLFLAPNAILLTTEFHFALQIAFLVLSAIAVAYWEPDAPPEPVAST